MNLDTCMEISIAAVCDDLDKLEHIISQCAIFSNGFVNSKFALILHY